MGKIISLSAVILGCILLVRAEPPVNSYSINGENNGYEYNSNIINGAYAAASKEGHRENTDFYAGGNNGHSLTSRNQGNLEESLRSNSYSGFSPTSHNGGFSEYASSTRDNIATSPYFVNNPTQSTFESFTSSNNNGDTAYETYTQGTDQVGSDFNQFPSSKPKSPGYMRFTDNLSGASSTGSYSELAAEGTSFREYAGDSFRGHTPHRGYMDGDQVYNREPSNPFNSPSTDYPYGKHKDSILAVGGSSKFMNDVYSFRPETRYVRGSHGNMGRDYGSSMVLSSSASNPFNGVRGSTGLYDSGKFSKYNKYLGDYTPSGSVNFLSKEQDGDYLFANYGKGSGKLAPFKENRLQSYSSQPYLGGPSYLSKIVGNYKSKPSFVNYSSGSPVGYSSMSNLHSSFSGNSYVDGPLLRRYRSSSYAPGHGSTYSGYY